jgi:hypothetical protein
MRRRKFLLASGSTALSGNVLTSLQRPALGLDFKLSYIPDRKPKNIDSILIRFQDFYLTPLYLDDRISMDIEVEFDIESKSSVTKSITDLSFTNGEKINISKIRERTGVDLSKIVIDGLNSSGSRIDGSIYVKVSHPDVSNKLYNRSFEISKKSITDDFDDGSLNTSKWSFIGDSVGASFIESSSQIKLISNSKTRPYLRTNSKVINGENGNAVNLRSRAKINKDGVFGQIQMYGWWDGNYEGKFETPVNAVGFHVDDIDSVGEIRIIEGGSRRSPASTSVSGLNSYSNWEIDLSGNFSNFDVTVYKDESQILSVSDLTFAPTNNSQYVAVSARETESTTSFDEVDISI